MSYLAKHEQAVWRQRLQRAYNRPDYDEALGALETLHGELECLESVNALVEERYMPRQRQ